MSIPYRTRQRLKRLGVTVLILAILLALVWVAAVTYLERYVIYTRDGVVLDLEMDHSQDGLNAVVANPPAADETVPIFYNEGENAVAMNRDLTQLWGYYISTEDLATSINACRERLALLEAGTAVMIELKSGFGTFNYSSEIPGAEMAGNIDIAAVDALIQEINSRNLYAIAKVSAFRDRNYGLRNVNHGIFHVSGAGLWPDSQHCYWLDPTNHSVISYITTVIQEVKALGFDEVVLGDFKIPSSDKAVFNGDRGEALASAAATLLQSCGSETFTLSFVVDSAAFALPEGRCRMYLDTVSADKVGAAAAQASVEDLAVRMVFLADTNDTRYDEFGVLRPLSASDVLGSGNRE